MADPGTAAQRASDLKYGHGSALWAYWTRGAGFAKWSGAAHKWTTLHALLLKAGVPAVSADGLTTNIITAVMPGYMKLAHAKSGHKAGRSEVTTMTERADAKSKPYGNVTYADSKNGKYPIDTEAHIRAAWAYINMPKNASQYPLNGVTLSQVKDRIRAAMKRIGADVADTASSSASRSWREIVRPYTVEDIHIVRTGEGDGTGRVVEAYAAVFDDPTPIQDHQGDYEEIIDRGAFDAFLARITGRRGGVGAAVRVLFNHGRTIEGTPAAEFQKPLGKPLLIQPDARGLLTRTEYNRTPLAEEVLEMIRSGSITAQSFVGGIIRSDPELRGPGDKYRSRGGALTRVRRLMLGLREYSPVVYAAYPGAEFLGVRMGTPESYNGTVTDDGIPEGEEYAPDMEGDVTGSVPEDTTSVRYHQHALYAMRSQELREKCGLVW